MDGESNWNEIPQYEGEDLAAARDEVATLRAKPNGSDYPLFDIVKFVFDNLKFKEPYSRAVIAARVWGAEFTFNELVDSKRQKRGAEDEIEAVTASIYRNEKVHPETRLKALRLHAEMKGKIVKAVEAKIETKGNGIPQITVAQYKDDDESK